MSTPEGIIKRKLDAKLKERSDHLWRYSPQAGPFGAAGVPDRLVLCYGMLVGIECKADHTKKPTDLQLAAMAAIEKHGGVCFVVYDDATIHGATAFIDTHIAAHIADRARARLGVK